MYLIGVSANCYGAGKTTLAEGLASIINSTPDMAGSVSIVSFAANIKSAAMFMVEGIAGKGPFDKTEVILGDSVTYRDVLLGLGQLARSWDPDFWLKSALCEMERRSSETCGPNIFIIDDMRFPNELAYLMNNNAKENLKTLSVYLTHEGYNGGAQNEAEGLLDPALFDIRVARSKYSQHKSDSLVNAHKVYDFIKHDISLLRAERLAKLYAPSCMEI